MYIMERCIVRICMLDERMGRIQSLRKYSLVQINHFGSTELRATSLEMRYFRVA